MSSGPGDTEPTAVMRSPSMRTSTRSVPTPVPSGSTPAVRTRLTVRSRRLPRPLQRAPRAMAPRTHRWASASRTAGDSATDPTFGPSGIAERLYCCAKNRSRNTREPLRDHVVRFVPARERMARRGRDLRRARAAADGVEEEEVVQLVRPDDSSVFCRRRRSSGGSSSGVIGVSTMSCRTRRTSPSKRSSRAHVHEVAHERLRHADVHVVHRHVVAVERHPAERHLGEVAGADDEAARLVGEVHQDLRALAGLRVLEDDVVLVLVVTDVVEVRAHRWRDVDLAHGHGRARRIRPRALSRVRALGGAEARHGDGDDPPSGADRAVERAAP